MIAMSNLKTFKNEDAYEVVIYETLKSYVELFDTRNTTIEKKCFKFTGINSS